jgi:hypothetical protein
MNKNYELITMNSGERSLLRHAIPAAANTDRLQTFMANASEVALVFATQGSESPLPNMAEAFVNKTPFLGMSVTEVIEKLTILSAKTSPDNFIGVEDVKVDGKKLVLNERSRSAKIAVENGLSIPILDMVTDAWMGKTCVPVPFTYSSPSHVKSLMVTGPHVERQVNIPLPIAMTVGTCAGCSSQDFTRVLDNHLTIGDIGASGLEKLLKQTVAINNNGVDYAELVAEFSSKIGDDEPVSAALLSLFSTDRRLNNTSLFILVMKLTIHKKKGRVPKTANWSIGWHCLDCVRTVFDDAEKNILMARLHAIARFEEVTSMMTSVNYQVKLSELWSQNSVSRRKKDVSDFVKVIDTNKSIGRSPGGATIHKKQDVLAMCDEFAKSFGPKSSEVKQNLFFHKPSKTWRVNSKSSVKKIQQLMNKEITHQKDKVSKTNALFELAMSGMAASTKMDVKPDHQSGDDDNRGEEE